MRQPSVLAHLQPAIPVWTGGQAAGCPGIRPDVDSTDALSGDETKEAARSGKASEFLRWLNTAKRRPLQQFPG
jgi:hypothetical protein